ncbi:hypothetical protein CEXT_385011 [Caerostris extrusa]|uniref:Uncharacterized protein n=1 Tax=Caerostris extrusa TaxID=172846 RepID=A0AAV4M5T7_CAEEX|nr:hypothetical protein CEXT_385011 [Caerostris extrusa]
MIQFTSPSSDDAKGGPALTISKALKDFPIHPGKVPHVNKRVCDLKADDVFIQWERERSGGKQVKNEL